MSDTHPQVERAAVVLAFLFGVAPLFSIAVANILLGAALAALLISRARWRIPPIWLPLSLFVLGTVASVLLSGNPSEGLPEIKKFYVFLTLPVIYTALHGRRLSERMLAAWGAVAVGSALVSFVQFASKYVAAGQAGQSFYSYYVGQRVSGFMSHWMTFSGLQMIVLLVLGAYVLWPPQGAKWRWVALAGVGLISASIALGLTRGVWVAFFVAGLYLIWCWNKKWLLVVPLVLVVGVSVAPEAIQERLRSFVKPQGTVDSNQFRIVTARTGIEMIKAHPWFGLGRDSIESEFDRFVPPGIARPLPIGFYGHLHNIYLQYAAARGIPTMLALMWMLAKILLDFRRAARRQPDQLWVFRGAIAVTIAILVEGLVEYNLGDSEILFLFLTVVVTGYLAMEQRDPRAEEVGVTARVTPGPPGLRSRATEPLGGEGIGA
jgi:putative inorganic carbon (hco3(-)) transporter